MHYNLVIHLAVDGHLDYFQVLIVMNKATINTYGFIKHLIYANHSIGKLPIKFNP